jgi:RNA polymerase sigma-70 factor (ECF subfamily)
MSSIEECSLVLSSMEGARSEIDLAALVETHSTLLFRVAYSVLRSRAEAEDVVQDVFVRVLEHRRSLLAVRDLRVWLVRIAWNLAIDRRRRIRPEQFDESFAENLVASSVPADEALDEAQRLKSVLHELERSVVFAAKSNSDVSFGGTEYDHLCKKDASESLDRSSVHVELALRTGIAAQNNGKLQLFQCEYCTGLAVAFRFGDSE